MYLNYLISSRLDSYRKNKDDIRALIKGKYPDFIYKKINSLEKDQIPVFAFHSVKAQRFEEQLKYLADNSYNSLSAKELYEILTGKRKKNKKSVVLTFDDGYGSIWSVVYPLLKKYGFKGISFLVTSVIKDESEYFPNLEDYWMGKTTIEKINSRDAQEPFSTWKEIKEIHNSGLIDFQSHTSFHGSVFVNNKLIDFANPFLKSSPLYSKLNPLLKKNNTYVHASNLELGYPIYEWKSSMSSTKRFLEDEKICNACVEFVKNNGGKNFFYKPGWKNKLKKYYNSIIKDYNKKNNQNYQSEDERMEDIYKGLFNSKKVIESKLNNDVEHLCYPWYRGSSLAVKVSREIGFKCNYWGLFDHKEINRIGDDPYYISRLNDNYIFSLPGRGRLSLSKQILSKVERYGFQRKYFVTQKLQNSRSI